MSLPDASPPTETTLRQSAPAWRLIQRAIGGPRQIAGKLGRLVRTVGLWLSPGTIDTRLSQLAARGYVSHPPTRLQLVFGSLDMFRFVVTPAARDYYRQKGIRFGLHQLLRVLDDPVSMIDPTGFLSDRDTIIGHVMQVVHLNPIYDLQLLQMFPDGLDELERQIRQMLDGSHPRAATIGAIVEEPGYHQRLLAYVEGYRIDRHVAPIVRADQTLRADPAFAAAERTFATLPGFIAYCNALPSGLASLLRRHRATSRFPIDEAQEPLYA